MNQSGKVFEAYKELPSWAKGVVVVGGLLIVYIVGNKLYSALKPRPIEEKNILNDIERLSRLMKPTYTDSAYDGYAETIYQAQRTSLSNDSGTIKDVALLMKNDLDVAKLFKSYGTRTDYVFGVPSDSYTLFGAMRKGIEADAFGAFSWRLGQINKDWESKGITYRL
jgi:hypothetical protein